MGLDLAGSGRKQTALPYAEAMLLIDHDQAQCVERDPFLEERMRADQNVDRARVQLLHEPGALFLSGTPGQQAHDGPVGFWQTAEERLEILQMLFGEDFGWSRDRHLKAIANRYLCGSRGDDRLAAADIALKQTGHRFGLLEIDQHFFQRAAL